jgi:hypothetical protein
MEHILNVTSIINVFILLACTFADFELLFVNNITMVVKYYPMRTLCDNCFQLQCFNTQDNNQSHIVIPILFIKYYTRYNTICSNI